jgi:pimeloyl-ACP methyl ester carboxylesterase
MKLSQSIRFCASADGTRIAVASCGEGPVILRAAHWLSHVDYDLESPVWRPWLQALSARNRFVRYDPRGCGLSDRQAWLPKVIFLRRNVATAAEVAKRHLWNTHPLRASRGVFSCARKIRAQSVVSSYRSTSN